MKDRVNDLAIIPEAGILICVTADRFIQLMRFSDHVPVRPTLLFMQSQGVAMAVQCSKSIRLCHSHLVLVSAPTNVEQFLNFRPH